MHHPLLFPNDQITEQTLLGVLDVKVDSASLLQHDYTIVSRPYFLFELLATPDGLHKV